MCLSCKHTTCSSGDFHMNYYYYRFLPSKKPNKPKVTVYDLLNISYQLFLCYSGNIWLIPNKLQTSCQSLNTLIWKSILPHVKRRWVRLIYDIVYKRLRYFTSQITESRFVIALDPEYSRKTHHNRSAGRLR